MANALYDKGRAAFLGTALQWTTTCSFKVLLVASPYTANIGTDQFVNDIASSNWVACSPGLSAFASACGIADADDLVFPTVSGSKITTAVLYHDANGNASTSDLLVAIDTATGLPLTPNGGNITLTWDNTATVRIFKI